MARHGPDPLTFRISSSLLSILFSDRSPSDPLPLHYFSLERDCVARRVSDQARVDPLILRRVYASAMQRAMQRATQRATQERVRTLKIFSVSLKGDFFL